VGDAPVVAFYRDFFLKAGEGEGAVELGERAIDEAPGCDGCDEEDDDEQADYDPNDDPQASSRRWR
jgi:hypothetical protein